MDLYTKDLNDDSSDNGSLHHEHAIITKDAFHPHNEQNAMEQSFVTILDHSDHHHHPTTTDDDDDNDVDDDNKGDEITPTSSVGDFITMEEEGKQETPTKHKKHKKDTVYDTVTYHDTVGKLVLTAKSITFQALVDDHNHHSWRWNHIETHKISPASSSRTLLKLISVDRKGAVTFGMADRTDLERIRHDISKRLRMVRNHKQQQQQQQVVVDDQEAGVTNEETALLSKKTISETDETSSPTGRSHRLVWIGCIVLVVALIVVKYFHLVPTSSSGTADAPGPISMPYTDDTYVVKKKPQGGDSRLRRRRF